MKFQESIKIGTIILSIVFICLLLCCKRTRRQDVRPNIVIIMSDDMGYSDIGCYGGALHTPVLDSLAKQGLRFTQFYNNARCCPTRASLLTGLYPHQAGIGYMVKNRGTDAYRGDLSKNAVTIAEVLKNEGYSTYMSGKWHLTPLEPTKKNPSKHNWPLQRGFDKFFGTIHGAGSYFDPNSLTRDNQFIPPTKDFYYTDAITDRAVQFIEEHDMNNPFFIYISYTAAHWPLQAKPEDIAKYNGMFDGGWDALRQTKYNKMVEMGIIKPEWKLSQKENIPDWVDAKDKKWESSLMEVYAAMVDCMDQGIGRVVNALKRQDVEENTLIFYLQDNGASAERFHYANKSIRPHYKNITINDLEPMDEEELQYDMVPKYTREGKPVLVGDGLEPGAPNTYLMYGESWANVSNTPFRMYKHWVHEGGISTPLIVSWPSGIKQKNEFRDQPCHLIDIMATCIEVADGRYPETFKGNAITPLEGTSLVSVFKNRDLEIRPIFWEHQGNKAVRLNNYKLVSKWNKKSEYNWELYDLEQDRSETNNLIAELPAKGNEMELLWKEWAKKTGVLTWSKPHPIE